MNQSHPFSDEKSILVSVNGKDLRVGLRPIEEADADDLVRLFRKNYPNWVYEFDRVYDRNWWIDQVHNDNVYAQVVVTSSNRVVGSFIIDKEKQEKRIAIGKVAIDPLCQERGIANRLGIMAIADVARTFSFEVMYSEARTNKPTTQRILYNSGLRPAAILFNKLSVPSGLEAALRLIHPIAGRRSKRRTTLLDCLIPFYKVAQKNFEGLVDVDNASSVSETVDVSSNRPDFLIRESKKSRFCEIRCNCDSPSLAKIRKLVTEKEREGMRTFLSEVSAYSPTAQQRWLDAGFWPTGYCPSWRRKGTQREDVVLMMKGTRPDMEDIEFAEVASWSYHKTPATWLIEPARDLAYQIRSFHE